MQQSLKVEVYPTLPPTHTVLLHLVTALSSMLVIYKKLMNVTLSLSLKGIQLREETQFMQPLLNTVKRNTTVQQTPQFFLISM